MSHRLAGKVAIITGSASGIGRATAVLFAEHGCRVVVNTDRRVDWAEETVRLVREAGSEAVFVRGDVAREADVARLVEAAETRFGRLDILVNNAAVVFPNRLVDMPEVDWDRTFDVCLKAVFWGAKHAIPAMQRAGGGAIVNISSINSGPVANVAWPAYTAAKGGLNALTRQLAIDYGPLGIRTNAVCPGSIVNESSAQRLAQDPIEAELKADAYPLGRLGRPLDVAYATLFLASDEAAFINGVCLVVDGGLTCQTPEAVIVPSLRRRAGKRPLRFTTNTVES